MQGQYSASSRVPLLTAQGKGRVSYNTDGHLSVSLSTMKQGTPTQIFCPLALESIVAYKKGLALSIAPLLRRG